MNTIILRKVNLGFDAVVKTVEGSRLIEFSVAENKSYMNKKNEKVETTSWYRCSFWTNAKLEDFLKKGTTLNVLGSLSVGAFLNKQNQPAADLKISVREIDFLDKKEVTKEDHPDGPAENITDEFNNMEFPNTTKPAKEEAPWD